MTRSEHPLTPAGPRGTRPPWPRRVAPRPAAGPTAAAGKAPWRGGFPAPFALPAGFAGLLAVGTVAAALGGRLDATGVLVACAVIVGALAALAEPAAALPLAVIGWLTVTGFSRPPYADLRLTGGNAERAAVILALAAALAAAAGTAFRWRAGRVTLGNVDKQERGGLSRRRQVAGAVLAAAGLPLLTMLLVGLRRPLDLTDDLLIFLVVVVAVTVVGGFWPAVLAAVAACLLLNWYFTPPLHTFTIAEPRNLLALVLFVTVAVAVSSVVHLAARRESDAARSSRETESLLTLAQTVLGGADTPGDVLDHLTASHGGHAELLERVGGRWIKLAASGEAGAAGPVLRFEVRPDLALEVSGQAASATASLLAGYTAQAVAALDRARLRTQAAQAEALAEGDRIRTALLRAVSHDLRTPLASIKASVSSLRQTDVRWTPEDESELLANIEQNADRLDALVGNLLDMSRLQAGSLEPFLRATAVDEVAPVALRGLDDADRLLIVVPDDLPLVRADPGLLERVLANLFSNALRHSPPDQWPALRAREDGDQVVVDVIDHGTGVPAGLKERIFEPFARLDSRTPGVGLGLAVAKGFAEAMGGTIVAVDTPGGGLTVRLRLPSCPPGGRPPVPPDCAPDGKERHRIGRAGEAERRPPVLPDCAPDGKVRHRIGRAGEAENGTTAS